MTPQHILLAEDDPGDQSLIQLALAELTPSPRVWTACNGAQALAMLRRQPPYESTPRPDLVLTDLHMPGIGGLQLLTAIRQDPALQTLPVILLTTSNTDEDVEQCYEQGCNAYVVKPTRYADLTRMVRCINDFWELVEVPEVSP